MNNRVGDIVISVIVVVFCVGVITGTNYLTHKAEQHQECDYRSDQINNLIQHDETLTNIVAQQLLFEQKVEKETETHA